ncbi:hypothetical protein P7K49_019532 [Saguinus oedipus]|uniref:Uncharacterized protein n=1 Tax=Saguinus oedipus TaxID=9490 RepID=A0ABQ9UYP3_SAGOE|nr:hypothetical protein P7K49_019532 [Saguinus oedipus]
MQIIFQSLAEVRQRFTEDSLTSNLVFTAECQSQQGTCVLGRERLLSNWANMAGEGKRCDLEANPQHTGHRVEGQSVTIRLYQLLCVKLLIALPARVRSGSATNGEHSSSNETSRKDRRWLKEKLKNK